MKKSERKILEKRIVEVVNVLIEKYEFKPAKKIKRIVSESAKGISKKLYKAMKGKGSSIKKDIKPVTIAKTPAKVKRK